MFMMQCADLQDRMCTTLCLLYTKHICEFERVHQSITDLIVQCYLHFSV